MRAPPQLWAALTFLALSLQLTQAQSSQSSSPQHQTEGERRLLEWDLNKSFAPRKNSFSPDSTFGSKTVTAPTISTKSFGPKTAAESASFYTPEFLTSSGKPLPSNRAAMQRFSTNGSTAAENVFATKSFTSGKTPITSNSTNLSNFTAATPAKGFSGSNRIYAGAEADKMKLPYTPDNGPKGGVSMGRQLTVDEVRDILNKSK